MKFEKKVIIGSITSFIITAVGIVAVFFPDLLNLQKEKFERYEGAITNKKDALEFANFLDKIIKKEKIAYLDVAICLPMENNPVTKQEDFVYWVDDFFHPEGADWGDEPGPFVLSMKYNKDRLSTDDDCKVDKFNNPEYFGLGCGITEYSFKGLKMEVNYYDIIPGTVYVAYKGNASKRCYENYNGYPPEVFVLNGYFYSESTSEYRASIHKSFNSISEKEIKLKNY
ncbi:hypothetical protein O6B72_02100 [Campylobacter ureolyticus]|uniref:hypothetical protein n=1 Tax=Campylobacter ureolyticus TaxID=827 RepID=UPI0022B5D424|nr:hypothetical protein [Campylobacter ureolyticus]MCZ6155611.1 hypothetical protein [Campylobacter ureolyticus]